MSKTPKHRPSASPPAKRGPITSFLYLRLTLAEKLRFLQAAHDARQGIEEWARETLERAAARPARRRRPAPL